MQRSVHWAFIGNFKQALALRRFLMRSVCWCWLKSSIKLLLIRNGRPPKQTSAWPASRISSCLSPNWATTCAGSKGAARVATALDSGIFHAAASTAAPPSEWPTSKLGAAWFSRSQLAAATRSSTLELKLVLVAQLDNEVVAIATPSNNFFLGVPKI